jgi:hypothetical protein
VIGAVNAQDGAVPITPSIPSCIAQHIKSHSNVIPETCRLSNEFILNYSETDLESPCCSPDFELCWHSWSP